MIFKTHPITILVDNLTGIFQIRVLVNNRRGWFQDIDKENTEKETQE
jgi:hypothetical protein